MCLEAGWSKRKKTNQLKELRNLNQSIYFFACPIRLTIRDGEDCFVHSAHHAFLPTRQDDCINISQLPTSNIRSYLSGKFFYRYVQPSNRADRMASLGTILCKLYDEYRIKTPKKLKIVDSYLVYVLLTGIIQFLYCVLVGTFPFNSFLSGFISTVACFILGSKLDSEDSCISKRKLPSLCSWTVDWLIGYLVDSSNLLIDWLIDSIVLFHAWIDWLNFFSCFFSACFRMQVNPENKSQFGFITQERALADFIFAHVILHLVVFNFIG